MFSFTRLLDLLCPPFCPICGEVIERSADNKSPICEACIKKIATPEGKFCKRCGGRRFVTTDKTDDCKRCRTTDYIFNRVIALGEYELDLRLFVLQMKTDRAGLKAVAAAQVLAMQRQQELQNAHADLIIPVPMHKDRRKDRGVNSAEFIADELGYRLKIPVLHNFIQRNRRTELQYTLSQRSRVDNVVGAFSAVRPNRWAKMFCRNLPKSISGKSILLIDDILTTGATCNEITKILLDQGVRTVNIAVLARAEGYFVED